MTRAILTPGFHVHFGISNFEFGRQAKMIMSDFIASFEAIISSEGQFLKQNNIAHFLPMSSDN